MIICMKKNVILLCIAILFLSCSNNSIYFDIKQQCIKSCNSNRLEKIYIESDSLKEFYYLNWVGSVNKAPDEINLKKINDGYNIYKGWNQQLIFVKALNLSPYTEYSIAKSQADASTFRIKIRTDKRGYVKWASQYFCK
jgi:hypothetical protein